MPLTAVSDKNCILSIIRLIILKFVVLKFVFWNSASQKFKARKGITFNFEIHRAQGYLKRREEILFVSNGTPANKRISV